MAVMMPSKHNPTEWRRQAVVGKWGDQGWPTVGGGTFPSISLGMKLSKHIDNANYAIQSSKFQFTPAHRNPKDWQNWPALVKSFNSILRH